jgi:hypothetical protein
MRHLIIAMVFGFVFAALTAISLYINSHRAQILFQPVRVQENKIYKSDRFRSYK